MDGMAVKTSNNGQRPVNRVGLNTKTSQLRVRLDPKQRQALEEQCARDREAGRAYAQTISSWLRYQIQLLAGTENKVPCSLSKDHYAFLVELSKTMNQEPEKITEACIGGIAEMIANPNRRVPLIVAEFRLRRSYSHHKENPSLPGNGNPAASPL